MPRITTHGINLKTVKTASGQIQERVSVLLGLPAELVTLQVNCDVFVQNGNETLGDPFIEICLFDRGAEKEDQIAKIVTEEFHRAGIATLDVYLTRLEKRRYFENGKHFQANASTQKSL